MNTSISSSDPVGAIIGERIKALRRLRHLTQVELARRIGICAGPMNSLEKGRHIPSGRVLYRLAEVLDTSVDSLLGLNARQAGASGPDVPRYVAESAASLGSASATGAWPSAVMAALPDDPVLGEGERVNVELIIRSFLALEDLCGAQKIAHIPLYVPFSRTVSGVEMWAQQVRQVLGVGPAVVFDYLELLENAGLRIIICPLPERLQSVSFYDARNANAFLLVRQGMNAERQLFELIKRLACIYIHTRSAYGGLPAGEAGPGMLDDIHAARQFAALFLMPASAVRASVAQLGIKPDGWTYELLLRLKHRFGVSAQSFLIRLGELQLINEKAATGLKGRIEAHYQRTGYGEPDATRRILSPNGRLGDLLSIASRNKETAEEATAIGRTLRGLKLEGLPEGIAGDKNGNESRIAGVNE
jgi:transcriptional regulator with XRE-family HTH domain/Zn-dependent peptidase ImmA (M78 family)